MIGAGSWGTALAIQFARSGKATRLWGRDPNQVAEMVRERANLRYLPKGNFPDSLSVGAGLVAQLAGALDVLIVVPSDSFRAMLEQIRPLLEPQMRLAWATKGFEAHSGLLPHQLPGTCWARVARSRCCPARPSPARSDRDCPRR